LSLKVTDVGELYLLDRLASAEMDAFTVHLYKNDYTPVDGSVDTDFTEADFSGYAGGISLSTHATPSTVAGRATTTWTPKIWTHNGGGTSNLVYGYFVLNSGGDVIWAERDPSAPRSMAVLGDAINVFLTYTGKSEV